MNVIPNKDLGPELRLPTLNQVTRLLFEHAVVIGDRDELLVAEALGIRNVCEIRVSGLAEFANNQWFIQLQGYKWVPTL